jgi:hypothetical protein
MPSTSRFSPAAEGRTDHTCIHLHVPVRSISATALKAHCARLDNISSGIKIFIPSIKSRSAFSICDLFILSVLGSESSSHGALAAQQISCAQNVWQAYELEISRRASSEARCLIMLSYLLRFGLRSERSLESSSNSLQ